jgi:ribonuclease HI
MRATIITDASFCPDTKAGGWAVWIAGDIGARIKQSGPFKENPATSNLAEIMAAINGCAIAYRAGARTMLIQSDCLGVKAAIMKGSALWKAAKAAHFPDAKITYRHVKGHTKNPAARSWVNRWCDEQAGLHMREGRQKLQLSK